MVARRWRPTSNLYLGGRLRIERPSRPYEGDRAPLPFPTPGADLPYEDPAWDLV